MENLSTPAADAAPVNRGEQLLTEAKALFTSGNYPAARQMADQAKAGNFGVEAQAEELLAQVALAEQGGALSLYESALDGLRKGDTPAPAPCSSRSPRLAPRSTRGLMQKVQDLLKKLPPDAAKGLAITGARTCRWSRRRRHRRPEAQCRGRHQGRRGPPAEGDRPRQGDRASTRRP